MSAKYQESDSKYQERTKIQSLDASIANHRTQNQQKLMGFGSKPCAIRLKLRIITYIEQLQKEP